MMEKAKGESGSVDEELADVSRLVDEIARQMTGEPGEAVGEAGNTPVEQQGAESVDQSVEETGKVAGEAAKKSAGTAEGTDTGVSGNAECHDAVDKPGISDEKSEVETIMDEILSTCALDLSGKFGDNEDEEADRLGLDLIEDALVDVEGGEEDDGTSDGLNKINGISFAADSPDGGEPEVAEQPPEAEDSAAGPVPINDPVNNPVNDPAGNEVERQPPVIVFTPRLETKKGGFGRLLVRLLSGKPSAGSQATTMDEPDSSLTAGEVATKVDNADKVDGDETEAEQPSVAAMVADIVTNDTTRGVLLPDVVHRPQSAGAHDVCDLVECDEFCALPQHRFAHFARALPMGISSELFSNLERGGEEAMGLVVAEARSNAANINALIKYGEAIIQELRGAPGEALERLTSLGRPTTDEPLVCFDMARLAEDSGDTEAAMGYYSSLVNYSDVTAQRQFALAKNARLAYENDQPEAFLQHVSQLLAMVEDSEAMVSRLGRLLEQRDEYQTSGQQALKLALLLLRYPQGLNLTQLLANSEKWLNEVDNRELLQQLLEALKQACGQENSERVIALSMALASQYEDAAAQVVALSDWVDLSDDAEGRTRDADSASTCREPYTSALDWITKDRPRTQQLVDRLNDLPDGDESLERLMTIFSRIIALVGKQAPEYIGLLRQRLDLFADRVLPQEHMEWLLELYPLGDDKPGCAVSIQSLFENGAEAITLPTRLEVLDLLYDYTLDYQSAEKAMGWLVERYTLAQSLPEPDEQQSQRMRDQAEALFDRLDFLLLRHQNEEQLEIYLELLPEDKKSSVFSAEKRFDFALQKGDGQLMSDVFQEAWDTPAVWEKLISHAEKDLPQAVALMAGSIDLLSQLYTRLQDSSVRPSTLLLVIKTLIPLAGRQGDENLLATLLDDLAAAFAAHGDDLSAAQVRLQLWHLCRRQKQQNRAQKVLFEITSLDASLDAGMGKPLINPLEQGANLLFRDKKIAEAYQLFRRAYALREQLGMLDGSAAIMVGNFAELALQLGQPNSLEEARKLFKHGIKLWGMPQPERLAAKAPQMIKAYSARVRQIDTGIEIAVLKGEQ